MKVCIQDHVVLLSRSGKANTPGIYTRVATYNSFIRSTIGLSSYSPYYSSSSSNRFSFSIIFFIVLFSRSWIRKDELVFYKLVKSFFPVFKCSLSNRRRSWYISLPLSFSFFYSHQKRRNEFDWVPARSFVTSLFFLRQRRRRRKNRERPLNNTLSWKKSREQNETMISGPLHALYMYICAYWMQIWREWSENWNSKNEIIGVLIRQLNHCLHFPRNRPHSPRTKNLRNEFERKQSNLVVVIIIVKFRFETRIDSCSSTPTKFFTMNLMITQQTFREDDRKKRKILPVVYSMDQDCMNRCNYWFLIENSIEVAYWWSKSLRNK